MRNTSFRNEHTQFRPHNLVLLGDRTYPVGYKVVTERYTSLGLRGNIRERTPEKWRILQYELGRWQELPGNLLVPEACDWGGIWSARTPGDARALFNYFERSHGPARILVCAMKEPLYAKPDRIKCRGVYPLEELSLVR